jgi:hypothetical protein
MRSDVEAVIAELLSQVGVTRVIVVDDDLDAAALSGSLEQVKGALHIVREALEALPDADGGYPFSPISGPLDNEELREALDEHWSDLPELSRLKVISLLDSTKDASATALSRIASLIPGSVEFLALPVKRWKTERDELLDQANVKTLVFFDRNLTNALSGRTGGDALVKEIHGRNLAGVYSGVFTQDATDLATEVSMSQRITKTVKAPIPVLGKWRAGDSANFAEGLRVFLHIDSLNKIRNHTDKALVEAFKRARRHVNGIGYYAIMATADSAHVEGLFEQDGLIRIASNELRRQTELLAREEPPLRALDWIRQAADEHVSSKLPRSEDATRIDWEDRFDSAQHLSKCNTPTEIGDIYEVTDASGKTTPYILLAQPCDLMVRADGKRYPTPSTLTLAELKIMDKDGANQAGRLAPIGRFIEGSDDTWGADLSRRIYLPPQLLDACVFSADGRAVLAAGMAANPLLTLGWQKMANKVDAWRKEKASRARKLRNMLPSDEFPKRAELLRAIDQGVFGTYFQDGKISVSIDHSTSAITAGIRRSSRLVEAHSRRVLILNSQYQARPDSPNDVLQPAAPESNVPVETPIVAA